jgi:hypothetical protein
MGSVAPDWMYRPAYIIVFALAISYVTTVLLHYLGIDFAPDFLISVPVALIFVFIVLSYDQYKSQRN